MLEFLTDNLPAIAHLPVISVCGFGVIAFSLLLYLFCRAPELLMVCATALIYAAVPLLPIR